MVRGAVFFRRPELVFPAVALTAKGSVGMGSPSPIGWYEFDCLRSDDRNSEPYAPLGVPIDDEDAAAAPAPLDAIPWDTRAVAEPGRLLPDPGRLLATLAAAAAPPMSSDMLASSRSVRSRESSSCTDDARIRRRRGRRRRRRKRKKKKGTEKVMIVSA